MKGTYWPQQTSAEIFICLTAPWRDMRWKLCLWALKMALDINRDERDKRFHSLNAFTDIPREILGWQSGGRKKFPGSSNRDQAFPSLKLGKAFPWLEWCSHAVDILLQDQQRTNWEVSIFFFNFLNVQHTQQQVFCKTRFPRKWYPDYRSLSPFSWWLLHVVMNNWLTQTVRVEHRYSQENTVWGKVYLLLSSVFFLGCVWETAEINWHLLRKTQAIVRLVEVGTADKK